MKKEVNARAMHLPSHLTDAIRELPSRPSSASAASRSSSVTAPQKAKRPSSAIHRTEHSDSKLYAPGAGYFRIGACNPVWNESSRVRTLLGNYQQKPWECEEAVDWTFGRRCMRPSSSPALLQRFKKPPQRFPSRVVKSTIDGHASLRVPDEDDVLPLQGVKISKPAVLHPLEKVIQELRRPESRSSSKAASRRQSRT